MDDPKEEIEAKMEDYLAYVNLVKRTTKIQKDGNHVKDTFKFFITQVANEDSLRRLISSFGAYNPLYRGTIASKDLQKKIDKLYGEELIRKFY